MRYLNSSAHGKVPVLRAGGETYLWMPATSGGENVWRHVLTRGTSPGSGAKENRLKGGNQEFRLAIGTGTQQQPFPPSNVTQELDQLTSPAEGSPTFRHPA